MSKLQDFEKILGAFMTYWKDIDGGEPTLSDFWHWTKYSHPYYEEVTDLALKEETS